MRTYQRRFCQLSFLGIVFILIVAYGQAVPKQPAHDKAECWLTDPDKKILIVKQPSLVFADAAKNGPTIHVENTWSGGLLYLIRMISLPIKIQDLVSIWLVFRVDYSGELE